jgi:hypothetical protein
MFEHTIKVIKDSFKSAKDVWEYIGVVIAVIIFAVVSISLLAGLVLGIWWVMWCLWMVVMTEVAANMPLGFREPTYQIFVSCFLFLAYVKFFLRSLFKPFKKEKNEA